MYDRDETLSYETLSPVVGDWAEMHNRPEDAVDVNAWRGKQTPRRIRRARVGYYGEITFIDTQIGRLLNWLSRHQPEALRNTWFIFASDHEDMLGDHHLWRKTYAYEGIARVPLIIAPPSAMRDHFGTRKVADEVAELRDIMPTILNAAGIENPPTVTGRSLLPLTNKASSAWRAYIHGEHCWCYSHEQEMHYVTDGRRKFVWLPRIDVMQFFNLDDDPGECHNLIEDAACQTAIDKWRGYLIAELAARNCGWVEDGKLHCPADGAPLVSPYKDVRYQGA